jgi:hypothetical protein
VKDLPVKISVRVTHNCEIHKPANTHEVNFSIELELGVVSRNHVNCALDTSFLTSLQTNFCK